jgi:hypothetical protein
MFSVDAIQKKLIVKHMPCASKNQNLQVRLIRIAWPLMLQLVNALPPKPHLPLKMLDYMQQLEL